jgi:hypothetical protein
VAAESAERPPTAARGGAPRGVAAPDRPGSRPQIRESAGGRRASRRRIRRWAGRPPAANRGADAYSPRGRGRGPRWQPRRSRRSAPLNHSPNFCLTWHAPLAGASLLAAASTAALGSRRNSSSTPRRTPASSATRCSTPRSCSGRSDYCRRGRGNPAKLLWWLPGQETALTIGLRSPGGRQVSICGACGGRGYSLRRRRRLSGR